MSAFAFPWIFWSRPAVQPSSRPAFSQLFLLRHYPAQGNYLLFFWGAVYSGGGLETGAPGGNLMEVCLLSFFIKKSNKNHKGLGGQKIQSFRQWFPYCFLIVFHLVSELAVSDLEYTPMFFKSFLQIVDFIAFGETILGTHRYFPNHFYD